MNGADFLATDRVPDTIFGIPVVADGYTEEDVEFFLRHPEAGGYYDMGDLNDIPDGDPDGQEGASGGETETEAETRAASKGGKYGLRPDGTPKGDGWLGPLTNSLGQTVTEWSMQSDAVTRNGRRIDFPTVVPTLTKDELAAVLAASAGGKPDEGLYASAQQKAVDFARGRIARGLDVWAPEVDPEAAAFAKRNPTLFSHVKGFEKLRLDPYDDVGGKAIGYGAHTDLDGLPVTAETRFSEHMANMALMRDLYRRREKLRATIPNWDKLSGGAKQALLDVSMGADDVLGAAKSKGLFKNLRSTTDPRLLNEYVKNHYYSYRNPDDANTREGLEARRIAGGKLFFGDTFSYEGKTWDESQNKFVPTEDGKGKTK